MQVYAKPSKLYILISRFLVTNISDNNKTPIGDKLPKRE